VNTIIFTEKDKLFLDTIDNTESIVNSLVATMMNEFNNSSIKGLLDDKKRATVSSQRECEDTKVWF